MVVDEERRDDQAEQQEDLGKPEAAVRLGPEDCSAARAEGKEGEEEAERKRDAVYGEDAAAHVLAADDPRVRVAWRAPEATIPVVQHASVRLGILLHLLHVTCLGRIVAAPNDPVAAVVAHDVRKDDEEHKRARINY